VPYAHPIAIAPEADVFIAGGGPAGLACAIALARKGHRVLVADGMKPPIDKACGEGLMPDTLAALRNLGIDLPALVEAESARILGIRFIDTADGTTVQARFPGHAGEGRGVKRKTLHQLLLDRAIELGVVFSWETVVRGLTGQGSDHTTVETNRGSFHASYVVGADGHQSRIRSAAGLDRARITAQRVGLRQHFAIAPWTEFVEVYWSDRGQAYVTPISATEICVAFVAHTKFAAGVPEALAHFPQLAARLEGAQPSDAPRGAITYSRKLHRVTKGNVALLGDASGSVDAVTGEGLSLAFRQALSLADAIHAGDLAAYQRSHLHMRRMPHLMASTMLLLDSSPLLRTCSIDLLARIPWLFAKLLEIHIGNAGFSPRDRRPVLKPAHPSSVSTPVPRNAVP
jgi:flavin-dependent dehydrogenase